MTITPQPRIIKLTKSELQEMLNLAGEVGASKALKHFGVFDERDEAILAKNWGKMMSVVELYETASKKIGQLVLNAGIAAVVVLLALGAVVKFKLGVAP